MAARGKARPKIKIVRLAHAADLPLPAYQTEAAAGLDLLAAIDKPLVLRPGKRVLVPTGIMLQLPVGTEGQVRPRSGLAAKHGVTVLNSPGTIDSDYRGEIQVILVNHGEKAFKIVRGERIAQIVIAPVLQALLIEAKQVGSTARGVGGFGSTGRRARGPLRVMSARVSGRVARR